MNINVYKNLKPKIVAKNKLNLKYNSANQYNMIIITKFIEDNL